MLERNDPTHTIAWKKLQDHFDILNKTHLKTLFENDSNRFKDFSIQQKDVFLDYSKNHLTKETIALLVDLAHELKLSEGIERMFSGSIINETEQRAVLHTALRQQGDNPVHVAGRNVIPQIKEVQSKMKSFINRFHAGQIKGYSGKSLDTIVNIGIGGSDLGPVMVSEALKPYWLEGVHAHFVSNVDASHIAEVFKKIDPERTLFIIASKSFKTQETMTNAHSARDWFLKHGGSSETIKNHFIALSTNIEAVSEFGIAAENIFGFWSWVGGRFSLSSSIGMSIGLCIGYPQFQELLKGLADMDTHFRTAKFSENIPVLLALIGIWYTNFFKLSSEVILPYDQYMHRFAAYFQQANMESNGKSVDRTGKPIAYETGPIIWGEAGTNGQHAFYQLIHQGTQWIHCDFIAFAQSHNPISDHHQKLLSNFFAQTEALMNGKTSNDVIEEFKQQEVAEQDYASIVPFKVFKGNRPSNSFLVKKLTAFTLGQLIAMYEHKIFVQGYIWNIFSFDQWGVELGKQLAKVILPELETENSITSHDSSTNGLINLYKTMR